MVTGVAHLTIDIRTIDEWGYAIGMSRGTIKCRCANAGVTARDSLAFARLLRAVMQHADGRWNPRDLLDILDPRTLRRLLDRAHIDPATERAPSVDQFLQQQTLVTPQPLMAALRAHLEELPAALG